jgi:ribosome-associated translation inhibitor RaiA
MKLHELANLNEARGIAAELDIVFRGLKDQKREIKTWKKSDDFYAGFDKTVSEIEKLVKKHVKR